MLNAVIVDDELPVLNLLKIVLEKTGMVNVLQAFTNPIDALENINSINPDVIFLDIEMPEVNGLELASKLMEQDDERMIVFVTGYNQYALEAFRVNALDYLLKPVTRNSVEKSIFRLIKIKSFRNHKTLPDSKKRIYCFGDFEVHGNSGPIKWITRKVEEMLAYFVVHREVNVDAWVLGEILWPEEEPEKIKTNLHTALFRLRKTIKEEGLPIEIFSEKGGRGTYRCSLNRVWCDFMEFEENALQGIIPEKSNIEELERISSLYKEDLFSRKSYVWCEGKKESLRKYYINMLKYMARFYIEEGMYDTAVSALLKAATKDAYDEEIHRSLLLAYSKQKSRAALIRCHTEFKQILAEEMNIEPQSETRELFAKLISE